MDDPLLPLLPVTIASLPTTQKQFDRADFWVVVVYESLDLNESKSFVIRIL